MTGIIGRLWVSFNGNIKSVWGISHKPIHAFWLVLIEIDEKTHLFVINLNDFGENSVIILEKIEKDMPNNFFYLNPILKHIVCSCISSKASQILSFKALFGSGLSA